MSENIILLEISKNFGENFRNKRFWSKFSKKNRFFRKKSILVKVFEKFRYVRLFRKISILVTFSKNFRFWSQFSKNFDFFMDLIKFSKKFDFGQNFRIFSICSKI